MITFPNAKINLGLNVVSKRTDGYHNIESVFYPIPFKDGLEIIPRQDRAINLHILGLKVDGDPDSNLCVKACNLITENFDVPGVDIYLQKNIPMGAGLGGGSADGAYTIKLLDVLFDLGMTEGEQFDLAMRLGSDCGFFIKNEASVVTGRGELIEPIDLSLKGYKIVLVSDKHQISTAEAYQNIEMSDGVLNPVRVVTKPINEWRSLLQNSFEKHCFQKYPVLLDVKESLYESGALFSMMSGSGSTIYGIFENVPTKFSLPEGFNVNVLDLD